MRIAKDGEFDDLYGSNLSTRVNLAPLPPFQTDSGPSKNAVSSGSYEILVGAPSWPGNVEIFITSARYIIVGGTQAISVSGLVNGVITTTGGFNFTTPFAGSSQEISAVCSGMEESTRSPVPCSCWYDPVSGLSLRVFPGAPVTNFMFSVYVILPFV